MDPFIELSVPLRMGGLVNSTYYSTNGLGLK